MEAAALSLLGVLLTASVTLVGLLFKRSVDGRTLVIAAQAEDSRKAEQRRLQLDAAARAVQMLSLADGSPAPVAQASSALLVLAELGESGLALSLVRELWPTGQISSSAAVRVIDDALSGTPELQRTAANALLANVTRLDVGDHLSEWPSRLEHWDSHPTQIVGTRARAHVDFMAPAPSPKRQRRLASSTASASPESRDRTSVSATACIY